MENWDEVRTAFQVARVGTVSGAAEVLKVHHATVIRHIDALEGRLGVKLFQRHARGYTATEAGLELFKVAQTTEEQFAHLAARINGAGAGISGELVVTSLPGLSAMVTPTLVRLQSVHHDLVVSYVTDARVFRLEYGEAHVAIRSGAKPQEPDNVVQRLTTHCVALYGSPGYLTAAGTPGDDAALRAHRFVGPQNGDTRAPFFQWLFEHVGQDRVAFCTNDGEAQMDAVASGAGLGFLPVRPARARSDLVEVMPPRLEWEVPLWLVTHVDLHRSAKVQAFLAALKDDLSHGAAR